MRFLKGGNPPEISAGESYYQWKKNPEARDGRSHRTDRAVGSSKASSTLGLQSWKLRPATIGEAFLDSQ